MSRRRVAEHCRVALALFVALVAAGCSGSAADGPFFGRVVPPQGQQLRFITGSEPESLDPHVLTGQSEARIVMALFEGLTEYDPQTSEAIPGLAERWEAEAGNTVFVFHLRHGARWSDGTPITAGDVVYSIRRGLAPALASRNAYMAYDIVNAKAFNEGASFVRDTVTGVSLPDPADPARPLLVAAGAAVGAGQERVPVRAEDVGVEAIDDWTLRVRTLTPVPFLPGLMAHQFFRPVPRRAIERHGDQWTQPERIVTSGPFTLERWDPYDRLVVVRSATYWDAARVRLDRITFVTVEAQTTMMNLYRAGEVDALPNHSVPAAWVDGLRGRRDYMNAPEAGAEYYAVNAAQAPMDDVRVRRALSLAIDRAALADFRRTAAPLEGLVPGGVFAGYRNPAGEPFDPAGARALLAEAGFTDPSGRYDASRFPADAVQITYNTSEANRQVAEFLQAQWKQNLGITLALRNMEFRTFLGVRARREFRGVARSGWIGDYMDPFTFLDLMSTPEGNNGTGWFDPHYAQLLRAANRETDPAVRFRLMAEAEAIAIAGHALLPLTTSTTNWMKKPYVMGMYANPLTMHAWKFVWIEHDPGKWH